MYRKKNFVSEYIYQLKIEDMQFWYFYDGKLIKY